MHNIWQLRIAGVWHEDWEQPSFDIQKVRGVRNATAGEVRQAFGDRTTSAPDEQACDGYYRVEAGGRLKVTTTLPWKLTSPGAYRLECRFIRSFMFMPRGGQLPFISCPPLVLRVTNAESPTQPAPSAANGQATNGASTQPAGSRLEFRIAPSASSLTNAERDSYTDWLKAGKVGFWWKGGRIAGIAGRMPDHAWLAFAGDLANAPQLVTGEYNGQKYVLVSDKPGQTMLPGGGKDAWGLAKAYATTDGMNRPAVGFELDDRGAELFTALTKASVGSALAIVVDGKVVSAPRLMSALGRQGMITGQFTEQEVAALVQALKAGMPPTGQPATVPAAMHIEYNSWLREITLKDSTLKYTWATVKPGMSPAMSTAAYEWHQFSEHLSAAEVGLFADWIQAHNVFSLPADLEMLRPVPQAGPSWLRVKQGDKSYEVNLSARAVPENLANAVAALETLCQKVRDRAVAQPAWGKPIEGFAIRLRPAEPLIRPDGWPGFLVDFRNAAQRKLEVVFEPGLIRFEADGVRYRPTVITSGRVPVFTMGPGEDHLGVPFWPATHWQWRSDAGGELPAIKPGKHTFCLMFRHHPEAGTGGKPVEVVSQQLEVNVPQPAAATAAKNNPDAPPTRTPAAEPGDANALWISMAPYEQTVKSLKEFAVLVAARNLNQDAARAGEWEIRTADNGKRIARLPFNWPVPVSQFLPDGKSIDGGTERNGRFKLNDEQRQRVGEMPDGEYLLAWLVGGKRCSNVTAFKIDSKYDPARQPNLPLLELLQVEPNPGRTPPVLLIRARRHAAGDPAPKNSDVAFATLNVDGQDRSLSGYCWFGRDEPMQVGELYAYVLDMKWWNYDPQAGQALPPVDGGKPHTIFAKVKGDKVQQSPAIRTVTHAPLGQAWDAATAKLPAIADPDKTVSLAGAVVDLQGKPAADYEVSLSTDGNSFRTIADRAGNYEFFRIPPWTYKLGCNPPAMGQPALAIDGVAIQAGRTAKKDISMEGKFILAGRVLDADGKPVANMTVDISSKDQAGAEFMNTTQTDAQGRYRHASPLGTITYIGVNGRRIVGDMPVLAEGMNNVDYVAEGGRYRAKPGDPALSGSSGQATQPASDWGASDNGVQARLRAVKRVWRKGEPPQFTLDVRNQGKLPLSLWPDMPESFRIEVDGQWYDPTWNTDWMTSNLDFGPGAHHEGIRFSPVPNSPRWPWKTRDGQKLVFSPGKHVIRVSLGAPSSLRFPGDKPDQHGQNARLVTKEVEIEVLPAQEGNPTTAPATQPASAPTEPKDVHAAVRIEAAKIMLDQAKAKLADVQKAVENHSASDNDLARAQREVALDELGVKLAKADARGDRAEDAKLRVQAAAVDKQYKDRVLANIEKAAKSGAAAKGELEEARLDAKLAEFGLLLAKAHQAGDAVEVQRLRVQAAQAHLEYAGQRLARIEALQKHNAATEDQVLDARTDVKIAELSLRDEQASLDEVRKRARAATRPADVAASQSSRATAEGESPKPPASGAMPGR
jgi:hypothetical protein